MNQKIEFSETKPWRKPGAKISDYFNYGFDENSWNAYCSKQAELRGVKGKENAKNRGKKGHTGYGVEGTSCAYSSPGSPSILAFRESYPAADLIGGQPESSRRQHRHRCLYDGGSNTQVFYEDSINTLQFPPPVNMNSLFEFTPPFFLSHPGLQPPFPTATLASGNSKGFDSPATSPYPCSSRRITNNPGMIDATNAWERYISQKKRNKDRHRSREHGHDKNSKRSRYREESCSSSRYSKQRKHRDARKRGYEHCSFERGSREKRRRDKDEGSRKTSESSSVSYSRRSRDVGGNRHSKRKHRKAKRSRKKTAGCSLLTKKGN